MIEGEGVTLRPARLTDFEEWAELRRTSREFLSPWEPTWSGDDLTLNGFRDRLARQAEEMGSGAAYTFLCLRSRDSRMFGQLSFGAVKRGSGQSAILGGWVGKAYSGRGLAPRAVRVGLAFAFGPLGLHRIEAATLPENRNSMRLLEHVGFKIEGFARSYGKINGTWRDHILFAIVAGDPMNARLDPTHSR